MRMRLGLQLAYWGVGPGPDEIVDVGREAEKAGYDSVWTAEAYGNDAFTALSWIGAHTSTINLGTAIAQMPARQPTALAMAATSLDVLSGGRVRLGIGPSGPQVAEGWYGQPFKPQITRTREYLETVRSALSRDTVEVDGETLQIPLQGGLGKALHLMIRPVQDRIPMLLASIGPKATALCGELAEGWLPIFLAPEHIAEARKPLDEGAARAGKSPGDVSINPTVYAAIDDDLDRARDLVRAPIALYVGGMGARGKNFYFDKAVEYGFEEQATTIQDLYLDGKREEAEAALPVELIDLVALVGPVGRVRERLAAFDEAGVDTLLASIVATDPQDRLRQIRDLAEAGA